jgi:hypothetical protein
MIAQGDASDECPAVNLTFIRLPDHGMSGAAISVKQSVLVIRPLLYFRP